VKNTSTGWWRQQARKGLQVRRSRWTRTILRNRHLIQHAFPTSSHLQVLLTSARRS
jgi:hypothetical protein